MSKSYLTLILKDLTIFPYEQIRLEFNNELSKKIINESIKKYGGSLVIVTPKDKLEISPNLDDLNDIGVLVNVKKTIILPSGNYRVTMRGEKRVLIKNKKFANNIILSDVVKPITPEYDANTETAYEKKIRELLKSYVDNDSEVSNYLLGMVENVSSINKMVDLLGSSLPISPLDKETLLLEPNYYERAKDLIKILSSKIKESDLEKEINDEVQNNFEKSQKDVLIKEKIKVLSSKLNGYAINSEIAQSYYEKLNTSNMPEKVKEEVYGEIKKFENVVDTSPEYGVLSAHLDFLFSLPWNKSSVDNTNIKEVDTRLNKLHYGLKIAKDRIEEYLILKNKNKNISSPILCLVGPPGTGKTTFARELASSIGREFVKISVGGLNDSSELIGHRRTYIGSGPGKIIDGIRKAGTDNPIILIDEIDKMIKNYHGDPASILLDILDYNQNKEFVDNYASVPFDLSKVIFILTANNLINISEALKDRLEIIEVNSYTLFDKINIAKKYTMPRLGKEYGFDDTKIHFTDKILTKTILDYTCEAGVRELERNISSIVRKILIKGLKGDIIIKEKDIENYLGKPKNMNLSKKYDLKGVVNVPAYTPNGGSILNVECTMYPGNDLIITGQLKSIMEESVRVATSYINSCHKQYKFDLRKLKNTLHIHFLDGASQKEGTSAGLAIAVAYLSYLTGKVIPSNIAFTGEITLNGRILAVGGIKEKVITAYNNKIQTIYIPVDNITELDDIPKKILGAINIITIDNFTSVYNNVFI